MTRFMRQSLALSLANLRSLHRRFWISFSMVLAVSLVVMVLLGFLAMANGFRHTLTVTGSPDVAIIMSRGAMSESTSRMTPAQVQLITTAPGIATNAEGQPLISKELVVPVDAIHLETAKPATLTLRGIDPMGLELRPMVNLSAGRMFTPGAAEIVIGTRLAGAYANMQIGDTISFGSAKWTVVGHFTANGSVFESEMVADAGLVQTLFKRENIVQSTRLKLTDPSGITAISTFLGDMPQLAGLSVKSEKEYFAAQAQNISQIILWLGWPLAITMAIGATIGALTTMYSSVSDRLVEIATVRAIGFSRSAAFVATLVEALALTIIGCVIGTTIAWLVLDGWDASTRGGGGTQLAFQLALTWPLVINAGVLALFIGLLGGGLPAFRATRIPLRSAMSGRP